ncbi:MAG: hypothetical protein IJS94_07830 [Clostridia bacterium]|nr:hypothetical protein [Clostridia bacterium]
MKKIQTITVLILILSMALSLASCDSKRSDAVDSPFSVISGLLGKTGSDDIMEYEGFSLDKGIIRYTFARMRNIAYENYKSMDEYLNTYGWYYGYETLGVTVDDSETFWNSEYKYGSAEGQTFAENAKESAVAFLKNALIVENLVKKYEYPGLDEENEKKIADYKQEMIDLYGGEEMFEIELASYPITVAQWEWWERSMLLITEFKSFLFGKEGPMEISSDDYTAIGVKPVEFDYRSYEPTEPTTSDTGSSGTETEPSVTEENISETEPVKEVEELSSTEAELTETAAASASTGETEATSSRTEASGTDQTATESETTTTTEQETEETFSEEAISAAKKAAEEMRDKIANGELTIDEAYAASYFAMYYPDGVAISKEELKNTFGIDPDTVKPGDTAIAEESDGLFLFCFCELSQSDYEQQLSSLSNAKFSELVESLSEKIVYKNDGEAYIKSLKITDFAPAATAKTTAAATEEE